MPTSRTRRPPLSDTPFIERPGTHLPPPSTAAEQLAAVSKQYWDRQWSVWQSAALPGKRDAAPARAMQPATGEHRFQARVWHDHPWYRALMQSYLINAELFVKLMDLSDVDEKAAGQLRFLVRQWIDATSPVNFAWSNPEVTQLAAQSGGESLRMGFANWLRDLQRRQIAITDETAFEVGRNLALSPGTVIFECELMQIIQYAPLTPNVARRPLLIVPPCVNKFYILDLQPHNSFVRHAVEQGYTVFLVSWRNPQDEPLHATWNDYLEQGVMQAIRVALLVSGADKVNTLGWCIGGTMLASALAVLGTRGDDSVASMTLLTTLLDFAESGDLGTFVDESTVTYAEQTLGNGKLLCGKTLALVFQALRASELLWPYVENNYLKGKTPEAFDLLYWNSDATNVPGPMAAWILRHGYLENSLRVPRKLTVCDAPFDLREVKVPCYVLAVERDHLVPWRAAWKTTRLVGGRVQFVLAASGHIAGVINPPAANKRSYQVADAECRATDPDAWLTHASVREGSWWTHWDQWLRHYAGETVPAPERPGDETHAPREAAPGRYVKVRLA